MLGQPIVVLRGGRGQFPRGARLAQLAQQFCRRDAGRYVEGPWWAVDKTHSTRAGSPPSRATSHAIDPDFPRICGRNHTENSQVGAADEILGTNKFDVPFI
jgi:hypothetical protein